jgi:small subunit ribosomal protein S17
MVCGQVISDKANKTVLVAVDRWMIVPKYKKRIRRTSKFMAHDENNECRMGDIVRIDISRCRTETNCCRIFPCCQRDAQSSLYMSASCRPLSKNKSWRMTDILRREKVYDAEAAARSEAVYQTSPSARGKGLQGGVNMGFAASAL